jgi:hypothetical protein
MAANTNTTTPTTTPTNAATNTLPPVADFAVAPIGHECCDGGMNLGQTEIKNTQPLFVQNTDNLCIVHYRLDTMPATVALGNATNRANVISSCSGLNERAVILPASVVFTDEIRGILASKNIYTANGTSI